MKNGVLDVHLVKAPMANCSNRQETTDGDEFGYGGKNFFIINAFALSESFSDEAGFVPFNRSISLIFNFEYPFTANRVIARRKRNHGPSVVGFKSMNFSMYSFNPLRVLIGLLIRHWFHQMGNIVYKVLMSRRQIRVRDIPMEEVPRTERGSGDIARSKHRGMVCLILFKVSGRSCGSIRLTKWGLGIREGER